MTEWDTFVAHSASLSDEVNIALVGKYVQLPDAYLSVNEALDHAGIFHDVKVNTHWVDAESLTPEEVDQILAKMDGILVPGGFGIRGIEGKIRAACYARENKVPYFGICLGMQVAVAEFARHVAGLDRRELRRVRSGHRAPRHRPDARPAGRRGHGRHHAPGHVPVQGRRRTPRATRPTARSSSTSVIVTATRSTTRTATGSTEAGMVISGLSPDGKLVEMVELPDHPWFLGNQGHPEFKSRPTRPAPLFRDFIGAAVAYKNGRGA